MGHREGTEGVDTLMHAEQLSFAHTDRDRFRSKPRLFELSPRHNPVLPRG
jgi:hypothetical protein